MTDEGLLELKNALRDARNENERLRNQVQDYKLTLSQLGPAVHTVCSEYRARVEELEGAIKVLFDNPGFPSDGKIHQPNFDITLTAAEVCQIGCAVAHEQEK